MNKSIIGAVVVVLASGIIFLTVSNSGKESTDSKSSSETSKETKDKLVSKAAVAIHDSEDDCWTIIDDNVYDISDYIPRHPGGNEILRACGADGTTLFEDRETESGDKVGSGTSHSSNAESILKRYLIGSVE